MTFVEGGTHRRGAHDLTTATSKQRAFVLSMGCGPNWDRSRQRRSQKRWDKHAAFMEDLVDNGFVILGGPIGDGEHAMLVVEATDESEVTARLGKDRVGPALPAQANNPKRADRAFAATRQRWRRSEA